MDGILRCVVVRFNLEEFDNVVKGDGDDQFLVSR